MRQVFTRRHLGIAAAAGVVAGGAAAYYIVSQRRPTPPPLIPPETSTNPLIHPALKHGVPVTSELRAFSSFVVEYDPRLRNPKWVLEHFTPDSVRSNDGSIHRKHSTFVEDTSIDSRFRASLEDYKGSGFDRGHQAPAANHKSSQQAMDDTFSMSNICPQVGEGFNRDYWARFERFVQELTQQCTDVFVVTGPLYLPRPDVASQRWIMEHILLGKAPRLVSVPTHFYKVILGESKDGRRCIVGSFVMPNAPINPNTPLSSFAVPLSALEEVAGTRFFPKYLSEQRRVALDGVSLQWQEVGRSRGRLAGLAEVPLLTDTVATNGSNKTIQKAALIKPRNIGWGMEHICEQNGCRLPAERWWEESSKKQTLRRTKSEPALATVAKNNKGNS